MEIYSDKRTSIKRRRIFRIKIYFLLFFISIISFGIFYLLAYSDVFKIKFISIENNIFLSDDEIIKNLRQFVLSSKFAGQAGFENMWSWPSGKIEVTNPAILEIDINKNWFKKNIEVTVFERERFAIWCAFNGKNCYWIDKNGILFAPAPLTEGSLVFTVFDLNKNSLVLGSIVEEERFIKNLITILENFNKTGFKAKKIVFDSQLKELHVETAGGPSLFFSTRFNEMANITSIKDLNLTDAEYIDLRVENKVYYKIKK